MSEDAKLDYEKRRREIFSEYKMQLQDMDWNDSRYSDLWDQRSFALEELREEFGVK